MRDVFVGEVGGSWLRMPTGQINSNHPVVPNFALVGDPTATGDSHPMQLTDYAPWGLFSDAKAQIRTKRRVIVERAALRFIVNQTLVLIGSLSD